MELLCNLSYLSFINRPKSNAGLYDTEIEVSKDRYQSSFEQIDLNVVSESQQGVMPPRSNNGPSIGGDGGDGGDAVGGNAVGGAIINFSTRNILEKS
jgi:hypothetical protein